MLLSVNITRHLEIFFEFVTDSLNAIDNIKFTAFGFEFTLLRLFLGLIILFFIIRFLRFGVEFETDNAIHYKKEENKNSEYLKISKHREGRNNYVSRHQPLRSAKYEEK